MEINESCDHQGQEEKLPEFSETSKKNLKRKRSSSLDDLTPGELETEGQTSVEGDELETELDQEDDKAESLGNLHFNYTLPEEVAKDYYAIYEDEEEKKWPEIGSFFQTSQHLKNIPSAVPLEPKKSLNDFFLKSNLLRLCQSSDTLDGGNLSPFQLELYSIIGSYYDLYFGKRTVENATDLRKIYCLHIMNHVLHSRARVIHHNSKLSKNPDEEYRDQLFTRTACLILVPFRRNCYEIVKTLISLLDNPDVMNKKKFQEDFGSDEKPRVRKNPKPEDYESTFAGNTNEDFKLGLKIRNKSICLFSEFYSSDIIIASPLGLRRVVGAEGDKNRDFDFLSSIEILILDQADVLMMQNWFHVVHILKHINLLPKKTHGCNFFRVRPYALEEHAKYYRQTLLLSAFEHAWFKAVFNHGQCYNHAGYLRTWSSVKTPSICQVMIPLPQVFRRFDTNTPSTGLDDRFNFFKTQVLPSFKEKEMAQTLIYIPSYCDFVRLRNYFREQELSSVMLCEYSKPGKVAQYRNLFFHGQRHFMLYTERAHFYNRYSIKGIRHVIFYELPMYPHFYQELCNLMMLANPKTEDGLHAEKTCTILVSQFDGYQLKHTVGLGKTKHILGTDKKVFMVKTEPF